MTDRQKMKLYQYMQTEFSVIHEKLDQKADKSHYDNLLGAVAELSAETKVLQDEFLVLGTKVDRLENKIDGLDTKFISLETRFDGLETRFDGLETRFDGSETRFDQLETSLSL